MIHDYFTIALVFGALAALIYGSAALLRSSRAMRSHRRTRRNDARQLDSMRARVGVGKVQLPPHAELDARTARPSPD